MVLICVRIQFLYLDQWDMLGVELKGNIIVKIRTLQGVYVTAKLESHEPQDLQEPLASIRSFVTMQLGVSC